ncbi:amino acid (glutamine) ABC transporter permease [Legionella birminghamensis]|uniref:Amino acid (Glutamine) ABC transporter permease n=1 Tax=Legionella birminghamensis TaxID=28083 RepID=A0A378I9M4_9GAMM|nr:amino acid ABC transporter permease [Legionella birminghamensis]KTC75200.1 amino acid (glutamine) ABC transporter permease [Legionella birminghamensis]STX31849.1 amino acid (glutamine) ABC transporter permease [Legionella birminghamensis]
MTEINHTILLIGQGAALTLKLLAGGAGIGFLLGMVWAVGRHQSILSYFVKGFISIFRGTPLILQLSLIYFAAPGVTGLHPSILTAGIIAFGLNSSAYFAELFRAGIESLPKGQFEAAKTLGIKGFYLWKDIIFPQVLRNTLPAIMNEMIALLKETALISTIGGMDIMRSSQTVAAEQFTYFIPLCIAGVYYYGLVLVIELAGGWLEKRGYYAAHS